MCSSDLAIESEPGVPTPVVAARLAFLRGLLASDSQEIETSCRHLREAVAHWKLAMVLALALARQGDAAGARAALEQADRTHAAHKRRPARIRRLAFGALALLALGDRAAAEARVAEAEPLGVGLPAGVDGMRILARARAALQK